MLEVKQSPRSQYQDKGRVKGKNSQLLVSVRESRRQEAWHAKIAQYEGDAMRTIPGEAIGCGMMMVGTAC